MTTVHADLASATLDLAPVAEAVGPFPRRPFLEAWAAHRAAHVIVVDDGDAALTLWDDAGVIRFAGEADLTDYHSPLGSDPGPVVSSLRETLGAGTRLHLDSMPAKAMEAVCRGLVASGVAVTPVQHEIAAVLTLADTHEGYLEGLDKKQRHEVRRKRRRFDEAFGGAHVERSADALGTFVDMHRSASGDKGEFMTDDMARFFEALLASGFVLDTVVTPAGHRVATSFGYEDDDAYYLYNSAFDPAAGHASPGVVLVDLLIERAIEAGMRRFDFLKGDEVYKFRLGAAARPLYEVEVVL
ncbi:MAG TPA: GNAT family N-acetyltransferase [Acidimicrobiia bacterium]|nr:GNAT family N-acetyltransferase [Acidimicrobiia bacterium]